MGNYSEIWIRSHNKNEYFKDDIVQYVNYSIPLFWLALFKSDNIIELKEEADNVSYYIFRGSLTECCQIFESRLNIWSTLYNDKKAEILAKSFLKYGTSNNPCSSITDIEAKRLKAKAELRLFLF